MRRRRKKRKIIQKFSKKMQKKLIVMFLVVTVLLVGLIGRLMYIEYTSGDKYEKIVLSQRNMTAGSYRISVEILLIQRERFLQQA